MQNITDEGGDLRKYRIELPNIIDDLGLDIFERALYVHYKRVCGANGGTCHESTRTTAEKTGMSSAKVSIARRQLAARGLITERKNHTIHVKIIDVWELNFAYYSFKERPAISGWTIEELQQWVESVYYVNGNELGCLPDKHPVYQVNKKPQKCLPGKTKNQLPIKKELPKEPPEAGKHADTRSLSDLPEADQQIEVLFGGRTDGDNLADAEMTLQISGWRIRGKSVKDALVYLLAATGWDVPTADGIRGDWYKSLREHTQQWRVSDLDELYREAHKRLVSNPDLPPPARPGALTRTMAQVWQEKRAQPRQERFEVIQI